MIILSLVEIFRRSSSMKNRKLEKLKNIIAIILLSAGVLMDIGVVLTGKYCLEGGCKKSCVYGI